MEDVKVKYIILTLFGLLLMIISFTISKEIFPYNLMIGIPGALLFGFFIAPAFDEMNKW